jgi:hypothetical protein
MRRLLLDVEVIEYLEALGPQMRGAIWQRLKQIAASPDRFVDYHERDERGRELAVNVFRGCAILFWDDFADRHLKVLEITDADELAT